MDYAEFQVSGLRCVIGGNEPAGQHMAGYNGVHSLMRPRQRRSAFVPQYAGLNLEHFFDGFHDLVDSGVRFEPRRAPMEFHRLSSHAALLYQPPTPFWAVESWTTFAVCEPHYIDMQFRCVPRKRAFKNGYLGAFWASYIDKPEKKAIQFRGRRTAEAKSRWLSFASPRHGEESTVRHDGDHFNLPSRPETRAPKPELQRFMYASMSPLRYEEPYYYGVRGGHMLLLMFDTEHLLRFCHSPSGGGPGNPAWDFYLLVPDYRVGREYGLGARLCYKPFVARHEAATEFAAWKRSSGGEEQCD